MSKPVSLKMGDRVKNPSTRGDEVGTVRRLLWPSNAGKGELRHVFVDWPDESKWEVPHLLEHAVDNEPA